MAIDPDQYGDIKTRLEEAIDFAPIDDDKKKKVEEVLFEQVVGDFDNIIDDSRPPRLYIFGRSGAGKSSLINALAKKDVADIGAVEPETVTSEKYHIQFPERHSNWDVVDSRGLFESVPADEDISGGTIEAIQEDITQYNPDIVLHMLTPDQARAGKQDFETLRKLEEQIPGGLPPILFCLNKVDTHLSPGEEWPPEQNEELVSTITDNLDFVTGALETETDIDVETRQPFKQSEPVRGYTFYSRPEMGEQNRQSVKGIDAVGIFPTYLKEEPYWNVETIRELVADHLPEEAILQFAQAQREDALMRRLSRTQTKKISGIGATIAGADLSGISDIFVLTALQVYLVMLIASFSCRDFGREAAEDYFAELGVLGGTGFVFRKLAGAAAGVVPVSGQAVNAVVAGGGTYAIGRSAESYYFNDEYESPSAFMSDGKDVIRDLI